MTHPDPEILTQLALDDPLALDAETLVHIADCADCTAEVEALQRTVAATELVRDDAELREVIAPPDRVWEHIALHAGLPEVGRAAAPPRVVKQSHSNGDSSAADAAAPLDGRRGKDGPSHPIERPKRRRVGAQLLAAAVVGVLVGAMFTWVLTNRDDDGSGSNGDQSTLTTSDLVGIDGHSTSGIASFAETSSGGQVTIELQPEDVGDGFIQAWLLDEDTGGMVALGVVDGDKGTFAVPPDLDLTAFNQIDISLEPYDGNPEHSAVSLARGPLP